MALVEDILDTPQTYSGEHIDRLAELGSDAAPAIGESLSEGYDFPIDLLYALREIGDPRAAEPILSYIQSRAPYDDIDGSHHTAEAIRVLGSIPNPVVCEPLTEIFEDISSHPRLRLASAATVFRSCEGDAARAAEDLLLEFYRDRREYGTDVNAGFHESEVLAALVAAAESDKVADILIDVMKTSPWHGTVPLIIQAIDGQTAGFGDALVVVVNDSDVPLETRLAAARRLLELNERSDDQLQVRIEELLTEAEANGYPPPIVEEARRLRRDSESQQPD